MSDLGTSYVGVEPDMSGFAGTLAAAMRGLSSRIAAIGEDLSGRLADGFDGVGADIADDVADDFKSNTGKFDDAVDTVGGGMVKKFAALGIGAAVADAFSDGLDLEAGVDRLTAQLGTTAEEAARIGQLAGETYSAAWGESLEEVQGFYAQTMRRFPELTDTALQQVTEAAATTADVFDQDFNSVIQAAQQLLINGLAPDAETAMNQVATALQRTRGDQDEVLESLNEYATSFAQIGLDGENIIGGLTSEWSTNQFAIDKVGDAVKEFGIRVIDGSESTKDALKGLGLSVGNVEDAYAKGGDTAQRMTEKIITAILDIEDPAERAQAGVALLGTPFEDLGNNAVPILRDVISGTKNLADTTDIAAAAYDNAQTNIESWFRTVRTKVVEFIGNSVIPALTDFGTQVGAIFTAVRLGDTEEAADLAREFADNIVAAVSSLNWPQLGEQAAPVVLGFVTGLVGGLLDPTVWYRALLADGRWKTTVPIIVGFLFLPAKWLRPISSALSKIPLVGRLLAWGVSGLSRFGERIVAFIAPVWRAFARGFASAIDNAGPGVVRRFVAWLRDLPTYIRVLNSEFADAALALVQRFGATIARFGPRQALRALRQIQRTIARFVAPAGRWLLRAGRDLIEGFTRGVDLRWVGLRLWFRNLRQLIVRVVADASRTLYRTGRDLVAGFARGVADRFATMRIWLRGLRRLIVDLLGDTARTLYSAGRQLITGLFSGIRSAMSGIKGWLRDNVYDPIVGGVKSLFGIRSPSTVFAGLGGDMIRGLINGLIRNNPATFVKKVFGGVSSAAKSALGFLVNKGAIDITQLFDLPQKFLGDIFGALGIGGGGGNVSGYRAMFAAVNAAFPFVDLISGFRPGATTATGNPSYHGKGRAIDINPNPVVFEWIRSLFGRVTKELIFSPAGGRQIHNGSPHYYTGITRQMHFDHIHWAMRLGGQIGKYLDFSGADDVLARLTRGEWVMPVDAVARYGPDFMQAIQTGRLPDALARFRTGGPVGVATRPRSVTAGMPRDTTTRTIIVPVYLGGREVERFIIDTVTGRVRVGGGDVQRVLGQRR